MPLKRFKIFLFIFFVDIIIRFITCDFDIRQRHDVSSAAVAASRHSRVVAIGERKTIFFSWKKSFSSEFGIAVRRSLD